MKNLFYLLLGLFIIVATGIYYLRKTPYGLLDLRTALALKFIPERVEGLSVETQREDMRKKIAKFVKNIPLAYVENKSIDLDSINIPIRLYSQTLPKDLPILIYYHGGGWVIGDLDTHDGICRQIAKTTNVLVVSVDYRLAPEHPFPTPFNDSYAAFQWIAKNGKSLGGNPLKIAVGGDSAGGNLAAAVALKAKAENASKISFQALIYPVTDLSKLTTTSYQNFENGFMLTKKGMEACIQQYTPKVEDRKSPYVSPLLAKNLQNLPPALVITAGFDPLRDEGEAYAKKLKAAGVPVTLSRYKGSVHGFFGLSALGNAGVLAVQEVAEHLEKAFK